MTSLALKTLHAALLSQWMEILYIPVEILNKMALWLAQQQNEDGAFVETAEHYYDRNFWVNTVDVVFLFQCFSQNPSLDYVFRQRVALSVTSCESVSNNCYSFRFNAKRTLCLATDFWSQRFFSSAGWANSITCHKLSACVSVCLYVDSDSVAQIITATRRAWTNIYSIWYIGLHA